MLVLVPLCVASTDRMATKGYRGSRYGALVVTGDYKFLLVGRCGTWRAGIGLAHAGGASWYSGHPREAHESRVMRFLCAVLHEFQRLLCHHSAWLYGWHMMTTARCAVSRRSRAGRDRRGTRRCPRLIVEGGPASAPGAWRHRTLPHSPMRWLGSMRDHIRDLLVYGTLLTIIFEHDRRLSCLRRDSAGHPSWAWCLASARSRMQSLTSAFTRSILGAQSYNPVAAHESV